MPKRLALLIACLCCPAANARAADEGSVQQRVPANNTSASLVFNRDVRPILSETCFHCHGPDSSTREADLRLDQEESAMSVIHAGDADASELVRRVLSNDADEQMPPPESGKELTPEQRDILRRWVDQGGEFQQHWAFIPPARVHPPVHPQDNWSVDVIDQFIFDHLAKENLQPSPPADKATLLRRVTLDLIGLPPTTEEIDDFVGDQSPIAYEKVIDRLMNSPRYGEHMAVPWLEASRYADTDGYQNDRYRYQHVWRDWVIQAFNDNMPYDQFITEQIAGDLLPDPTLRQQIATGFGRNHRINSEDGSIPEEWRTANVIDRVDTFGTVFLGLTIECSRCHDHKYDPISQKEYYQLFAYFNNIAEWGVGPNNGNSPPFIQVPKSWPNLSESEDRLIPPEPVALKGARKEGSGNGLKRPQAGDDTTLMVMHELQEPRETYLLLRGQYNMPDKSQRLWPDVPKAIDTVPLKHTKTNKASSETKNRLQLAQWLVDPSHPLTARVAVNRIWQQFFAAGLVESSENFGSQGTPPSHPELLDWLALELIESNWDIRVIQKRVLLSKTYQQSSRIRPQQHRVDPKNRLLSRALRVRLPGFTLRDQALAASGLLVNKIGGPSAKPYMPPKIWRAISNNTYTQDAGENLFRRSVYTYWRRTIPPPTMMNFNAAAREVCVVRTERTNTPLQALTLMNNKIFVESSRFLAQRILQESSADWQTRIDDGFRIACGRKPTAKENKLLVDATQGFLKQFREDQAAARQLLSVGEAPRDTTLDVTEHAALTMTASLILNLDETITKE